MRFIIPLIVLALSLLPLAAKAGNSIEWDTAKGKVSTEGVLTVEVSVTVKLDTQGTVKLFLQDGQNALGDPQEANVTVAKGKRKLTLTRTAKIERGLTEVLVFTPLYAGADQRTSTAQAGVLKIDWSDRANPTVAITMPE